MVIKGSLISNTDGPKTETKSDNSGFWGGLFGAVAAIGSSALSKPATTNNVTNNTEVANNTAMYIGIGVAVIVVIVVVALLVKKK